MERWREEMKEDNAEGVSVTLSASQLRFLRGLLEDAAGEHDRFVARVLDEGAERWDGEWPDAAEMTAQRRSDAARGVLANLEKACPEVSTETRRGREGLWGPATLYPQPSMRHQSSLGF
jgi:hypothetical protein